MTDSRLPTFVHFNFFLWNPKEQRNRRWHVTILSKLDSKCFVIYAAGDGLLLCKLSFDMRNAPVSSAFSLMLPPERIISRLESRFRGVLEKAN